MVKGWQVFIGLFILLNPIFILAQDNNQGTQYYNLNECTAMHTINKMQIVNRIQFSGYHKLSYSPHPEFDCYTGTRLISTYPQYPRGSGVFYAEGFSLNFGGIVDDDTLVSQSNEIRPHDIIKIRSSINPSSLVSENAVSEQDFIVHGADTFSNIPFLTNYDTRPHKPMNVKVTSESYAWSYGYADDLILIKFKMKNIGKKQIHKMYFRFKISTWATYIGRTVFNIDDIGGYRPMYIDKSRCDFEDSLKLVWVADNDGDPANGEFTRDAIRYNGERFKSTPDVVGVLYLDDFEKLTLNDTKFSYNWHYPYYDDFGPMSREKYRYFKDGGTGFAFGDPARYHVMSNGEIDYDQIFMSKIYPFDETWLYPNQAHALDVSDGYSDIEHQLSIGPFELGPGQEITIPMAYVGGEDFHTDPTNGENLPDFPSLFYQNLDFSDIAKNSLWARWIYDNPGIDTDDDGYFGEYHLCVNDSVETDNGWSYVSVDTFWYKGDGVPDWRAAGPPPAPAVWVTPIEDGIHIRFNGSESETEKDIFTKLADFEGYNIYMGRDEREESLSLIASLDKYNFDKYVYHPELDDNGRYVVGDIPYSLDSLHLLYGDTLNPIAYNRVHPFRHPDFPNDSLFFFLPHADNGSEYGLTTPIGRVHPEVRDPRLVHPDSLVDDDYTEEGYFKYFEYQFEIKNLLSTVGYWVNVTAFDFGSPKSGLKALETSKTLGLQLTYPLTTDEANESFDEVYVYPNPYLINGDYRAQGLEGRTDGDRPDYRVRSIWFANLPPKCTIKIFSLDGDLIRKLVHDYDASDPDHRHQRWDLITRNTQMIVSGLYYWTVEFPDGSTQVGKLVIIM